MKKLLLLFAIITAILTSSITASAMLQFTVTRLDESNIELPLEKYNEADEYQTGYRFDFQGNSYLIGKSDSKYTIPKKINSHTFSEYPKDEEYVWNGQYYMVRDNGMDSINGYAYNVKPMPIRFYDNNKNLVKEYTFDNNVVAIGYYNDTFYCKLFRSGKVMKSTDMENWEETAEPVPYTVGNITFAGNKVAFYDAPMMTVNYEDGTNHQFWSTLGNWILERDDENGFYLSNDNVYFVKIEVPYCKDNHNPNEYISEHGSIDGWIAENQCPYLHKKDLGFDLKCIYEYGDDIVLDMRYTSNSGVRLIVLKADIYAELERQKSAPYIMLNDAILGFEQAPVIEQDRTLVPMRFLFEQMGADVDWDETTETATVTKDGEQISFQIDSPAAKVDSEVKLMDVPAKLVNDKTMVPLRFLSENLGYKVQWDEATRMVKITTE